MPKKRKHKNTIARSRLLENAISGLRHLGFAAYKNNSEFENNCDLLLPNRYLIRNYPHPSLYGTPGRKEAYIYDSGIEYILEAKYQNANGSTDEKPPYIWECFLDSKIQNWIVWFDGHYWLDTDRGQAAIGWLRQRALQSPDSRNLHVCATEDEWVNLVEKLFKSCQP